jgi:hypothetical protein
VRGTLKDFAYLCYTNEEYAQKLVSLERAAKSEQWRIVIEILWSIKNKMASELVSSSKVTKLDATEKDIVQRVYHEVNEIIDFLTNPVKWVGKKGLLARTLATVKKEREAQDG